MNYFENLKTNYCNDYLTSTPTKKGALNNNKLEGVVKILENSNNRAITIFKDDKIYLQSYDTIVLCYDIATNTIKKMWEGYSVTTMKHINTFIGNFTQLKPFNKKSWLAL